MYENLLKKTYFSKNMSDWWYYCYNIFTWKCVEYIPGLQHHGKLWKQWIYYGVCVPSKWSQITTGKGIHVSDYLKLPISVCTVQKHTHNIAWLAECMLCHSAKTFPSDSPGQCAVSLWCNLERFNLHLITLFYDFKASITFWMYWV